MVFVVVSGLVFYFALQRAPVVNTIGFSATKPRRVSEQSSPRTSAAEQKLPTSNKKKCACRCKKLAQSRKTAKQRMQTRKAWAREMLANYGYEEGTKQILAKQIQRILERAKQPNLASAVAQSSSQ